MRVNGDLELCRNPQLDSKFHAWSESRAWRRFLIAFEAKYAWFDAIWCDLMRFDAIWCDLRFVMRLTRRSWDACCNVRFWDQYFGNFLSDMFTLSQSCLNRYGHLSLMKFQIQMFQMCFLKRTLTTALSAQTSMRKYDETNTLNSDEIEQSGVRSKIP